MFHLLIIALGIAAFHWSDFNSDSTFFNFVLPLVFFVAVLYAMGLGVALLQGRGLVRKKRSDAEMRFWAEMSAAVKEAKGKEGDDQDARS